MYPKIKRIFDILTSILGLIILSPLLIAIALILSITNHGTPLFLQNRPGLNNKIFHLYKFKTMIDKKGKFGELLPDKERITIFGKIVRNTSLDELPQLINLLKGDMSLIGPRPLLSKYLPLYNSFQARRHEIRPGITGWAQVNGRNAISWQQKFEYDVWYIDNMSFWLDVKILLMTIKKVILREGINAGQDVTMEEFRGNDKETRDER
jgi:lipopolysaccharide/colanic/teichoic acid biosynthesis glycosyltransferase